MSQTRSAALLLCATAAYGLSGALAAGLGLDPLAYLALVAGAQAAGIALWSALRRRRPRWCGWRVLAVVTGLDGLQNVLYLTALGIGPVGPVAAFHLTVPVWFLLESVGRRRRRFGAREGVTLLLMLAGAALAGGGGGEGGGSAATVLALLLSTGSAVLLAVLLRFVAGLGGRADVPSTLMLHSLAMSALAAPALLLTAPRPRDVALVVAVGLTAFTMAGLLQWSVIARLRPTVYGSIGLSEALFTAVVAAALFGEAVGTVQGLAAAAILGAVWLEVTHRVPDRGPHRMEPGATAIRGGAHVADG